MRNLSRGSASANDSNNYASINIIARAASKQETGQAIDDKQQELANYTDISEHDDWKSKSPYGRGSGAMASRKRSSNQSPNETPRDAAHKGSLDAPPPGYVKSFQKAKNKFRENITIKSKKIQQPPQNIVDQLLYKSASQHQNSQPESYRSKQFNNTHSFADEK